MRLQRGLMSISDFAAYCGSTRQTMQYYDRIGLLQPVKVGDQGYRYYHPLQGHEVRLIHSLQRCGCSLDEVSSILDSPDIDTLKTRMEEKQKVLRQELLRINREQVYLDRVYRFFQWAENLPVYTPTLVHSRKPMYLENVVHTEECGPYTTRYYEMILQYAEYYRQHHAIMVYPYALYVDPQELNGELRFSRVLAFPEDMSSPSENSVTAEPGQYLCLRGYPEYERDTRPEAYEVLHRFLVEHGLRTAAGSFEIPYSIPQGLRRDDHLFSVVLIMRVVPDEKHGVGGDKR